MANYPYNTEAIAKQIIAIEGAQPGRVRGCVNPFRLYAAVDIFKNMGFRKSFFTSTEQFFWDCVLTNESALARMLPSSMLAGPQDNERLVQCWAGSGPYIGEQGIFQSGDFTSGGKDRMTMILNIEPFFDELAPVLWEPKRRTPP